MRVNKHLHNLLNQWHAPYLPAACAALPPSIRLAAPLWAIAEDNMLSKQVKTYQNKWLQNSQDYKQHIMQWIRPKSSSGTPPGMHHHAGIPLWNPLARRICDVRVIVCLARSGFEPTTSSMVVQSTYHLTNSWMIPIKASPNQFKPIYS